MGGRFERVGGDTLFFGSPGQPPMAFRFNAIDTLWRQGNHLRRGAWIGGTTLGLFGFAAAIIGKLSDDATPFAHDLAHATYDGDAVRRWWHALTHADRLLKAFRGGFAGKCSPTHFWWGGFDLACTRFSGRSAPQYQGTIPNIPCSVMEEAYSRECISAGWWPGTDGSPVAEPAYYAYAYPEPPGCRAAAISPAAARYDADMRDWILPYEAVRTARDPDAMVLEFLESTYEVAARLGDWDIAALRASRGTAITTAQLLRGALRD